MTGAHPIDLYYDPYDFEIDDNPYPIWKRLRDEAPFYYNEKHNFYALSRYDDVAPALTNWDTFRSGRGTIAHIIFSGERCRQGSSCGRTRRLHDLHRDIRCRACSPTAHGSDRAAGETVLRTGTLSAGLDGPIRLHRGSGALMPMHTIGYLLGIPEADQETIRERTDNIITLEDGKPPPMMDQETFSQQGTYEMLADYIEWRAEHPSDDLMTELLNAEAEEEDGTRRPLTRAEVITYSMMVAGGGKRRRPGDRIHRPATRRPP